MRRIITIFSVCLLCCGLLAGCGKKNEDVSLKDGVYMAEFKEYDSFGYKDQLRVTVEDGVVVSIEYDAVNEEGTLKTKDADYEKKMQGQQETYPSKYTADLVNQFMESGSIDGVNDIAGATWSSECFRALYLALVPQMEAGSAGLILVDNVPER